MDDDNKNDEPGVDDEDLMWYRVVDPGSPLCGWDLLCGLDGGTVEEVVESEAWYSEVLAARRLDVLLGDRPLQFNPPGGIGMLVDIKKLDPSPVQTGTVEIGSDAEGLYGEHLERRSYSMLDPDMKLDIEIFAGATLAALDVSGNEPLAGSWFGEPDMEFIAGLEMMFENSDVDGLQAEIIGGPHGRAQA